MKSMAIEDGNEIMTAQIGFKPVSLDEHQSSPFLLLCAVVVVDRS